MVGHLLSFEDGRRRREARASGGVPGVQVFSDLADPFSYLTAERVDRAFAAVEWQPALQATLERRDLAADAAHVALIRAAAERRAQALRLPLQWPDRFPAPVPAAMRAATYAVECHRGGAFMLAAGRLAFAGGFDLEDPEILAEAAAAANLGLDATLAAAADLRRDAVIELAGRRLVAAGADKLPALLAGSRLLWGEARVTAFLAAGGAAAVAPA